MSGVTGFGGKSYHEDIARLSVLAEFRAEKRRRIEALAKRAPAFAVFWTLRGGVSHGAMSARLK